ncbi:MAG TPA: hypothetical protein VED59_06980, partial [Acidimicrobiales bacterium]|nr:hypothetical protein [Acidimicrobiales bacterium]
MGATPVPPERSSPWRDGLWPVTAKVVPPVVVLALLALAWELVAAHNQFLVPSLGSIWSALASHPRQFAAAAAATLEVTGVGLGASFVVAFGLAIAMSHFRVVERAVMPLAVVLNVTPIVAVAPGLAAALGVGKAPRY